MTTLHVKNWRKFQHYKDRCPPWIKLQRTLLDNMDYALLSAESAKVLPLIWLVASENDGVLPEMKELAFRLRTTEESLSIACKELVSRGFISPEQAEQVATQSAGKAKKSNPSRYIPDAVKFSVLQRDGGICQKCGATENIEYDHIIPVSRGGKSTESNIQLLCRSCNRKKRTRIPEQAEQVATQELRRRSLETETETETEGEGVCDAREIRPEVSAAKVLRERKLIVTPSHPDLIAACREGVTPEDLIDMASLYPDKPAGYVIAACRRQHAEQANPVKIGESHANRHRGRKASTVERTEAALQGFLAEHGA